MAGRRHGRERGKPQAHRRTSYDPSTGPWRTGVVVREQQAVKAITAAERAGLSFAGLINELVRRMEVDENGRPVWADELNPQEELPKAG